MDIAQKLREEGYKVTPQRIAIYNVLYAENNHPTAEMIYQSLREDHPSMSLATVYKTMEIFERIGLVRVLDWAMIVADMIGIQEIIHMYVVQCAIVLMICMMYKSTV